MAKPKKPHRDFPLYAHASGQWAKKIRQKVHYFGPWANPQAALEEYLRQKDDLLAGRTPTYGDGLTVKQLVNSFLSYKKRLVDSGEIRQSSFQDYYDNCERVLKIFGRNTAVASLRPGRLRESEGRLCQDAWSRHPLRRHHLHARTVQVCR